MPVPVIRSATEADLPAVGQVLASAFKGDPVWSWLTSPKANWDERAAAWFRTEAKGQIRGHGEVLMEAGGAGAAIWAPPGKWKSTTAEGLHLAVPSLRLFRGRMPRAIKLVSMFEKAHPKQSHWYLAILGTDPAQQGRGIGSALISEITDRCDNEGLSAYLESSKESNVPFYARHGFEVSERVDLPDGPPVWRMWRDPRSS